MGSPIRYNLTGWAIKLNELTDGLEGKLAPTDCRLRPDQRATELGNYDEVPFQKSNVQSKNNVSKNELGLQSVPFFVYFKKE